MSPVDISVTLPPDVADIVGKGINQGGDEDIAFALRLLGFRSKARRAGDLDTVRQIERDLVRAFAVDA